MPRPTAFRTAEVSDAEEILGRLTRAFEDYRAFAPPSWDPPDERVHLERTREEIARDDCLTLIAPGAGHVHVVPITGEPVRLRHLFIEPEHQGTGLAVALHAEAIRFLDGRPARLFTPAPHARARHFYEREGWTLHAEFEDEHFGMPLAEYRFGSQ